MFVKNKGQFYIGKIEDFSDFSGYFMGCFMKEKGFPLLQLDEVEVAWKKIPRFVPEDKNKHTHKKSVEINIIISGWVKVRINSKEFKIKKGEFFVVYPYAVVEDLESGKDTEMIVVKSPSLAGDKYKV